MLGEFIRQAREARGMEQEDLGLAIGRTGGFISSIETGRRKSFPNPELLAAIAHELRVPVIEFIRAAGYDVGAGGVAHVSDQELSATLRSVRQAAETLTTYEGVLSELLATVAARDAELDAAADASLGDRPQRQRKVS